VYVTKPVWMKLNTSTSTSTTSARSLEFGGANRERERTSGRAAGRAPRALELLVTLGLTRETAGDPSIHSPIYLLFIYLLSICLRVCA